MESNVGIRLATLRLFTMPVGALSATYTDSLIINMLGFYFIALPLFLFGLFFWGTIGKQGNKIAPKKFGYFTAFLLIGFGIYLIYIRNKFYNLEYKTLKNYGRKTNIPIQN